MLLTSSRRRGLKACRLAVCAAILASGAAGRASAQTSDDLFDPNTLQEVRITMSPADLRALRDRWQEKVYFPADFTWRGMVVTNIGVRMRGLASRSPVKPSLRLEFNHYTKGQHFLGLKSLGLKNMNEDPSMIHESLALAFFKRMGQPAPRESFARVYLNGSYQGLYGMVESIDGTFLKNTFGEKAGYLLEREFVSEFHGEDLGDPEAYKPVFQAKKHKKESDTVQYSPIADLFHDVNQPVDATWRDAVSKYLDLPQFVTHVAIEQFLSEFDGVLGHSGMTNFDLYRAGGSNTSRFIVWDKDKTFTAADSPVYQNWNTNQVFSRAMTFPDLRALYQTVLTQCAQSATAQNWLSAEIVRETALIRPSVYEDTARPFTNDFYEGAVQSLKEFAQTRPAFVLNQVAQDQKSTATRRR
jgi:spore coat protein CotH